MNGAGYMKNKIRNLGNLGKFRDNDKKIISISKNKKISLSEKIKNYKGENLVKDFSWDDDIWMMKKY